MAGQREGLLPQLELYASHNALDMVLVGGITLMYSVDQAQVARRRKRLRTACSFSERP